MRHRPRACGKTRYPSREAARHALEALRRNVVEGQGETPPDDASVYRCGECKAHHIGRPPYRLRRKFSCRRVA